MTDFMEEYAEFFGYPVILIKYHNDNLTGSIKQVKNSDWIDLRAAETIEMKAGDHRLISLGISARLPQGYEAHIAPRSSTFKNFGILQTNGVAVIDESYCGDDDVWKYPALAMRDTTIHEGDRICQFRIMRKMGPVNIKETSHLSDESRGGFGSTGIA